MIAASDVRDFAICLAAGVAVALSAVAFVRLHNWWATRPRRSRK
jgi:hypothetical protein